MKQITIDANYVEAALEAMENDSYFECLEQTSFNCWTAEDPTVINEIAVTLLEKGITQFRTN